MKRIVWIAAIAAAWIAGVASGRRSGLKEGFEKGWEEGWGGKRDKILHNFEDERVSEEVEKWM